MKTKRRTRAAGRLPVVERAAFEGLPVAATILDPRGRVIAANREAVRLAGAAPAGGPSCRAYWRCRLPSARCPLRRSLRSGKPVYHARVREEGPRGERIVIERVAPIRLPSGARGAVVVTGPATAFYRRLDKLRVEASTDYLTTVLNRGRFDDLTLRAGVDERRGRPSAFVMMDVDGLKSINDLFGHAAGDRVLRRLGRLLLANTRRGDLVGRVGGDEFAIFCPDTSPPRARLLVRRLREAVASDNASWAGEPRLSVQFGLACSGPGHRRSLRERADAALYARKRLVKRAAARAARR